MSTHVAAALGQERCFEDVEIAEVEVGRIEG